MSQGISFSGLGSGLDTDSIIDQLVNLQRRPIQLIGVRQTRLDQQKQIVESIASSLLTLKGSVRNLEKAELFTPFDATSSDEAQVGVVATDKAASGTFTVEVLALAQAQRLSSRSFGSPSTGLGLSGAFVLNGRGIEVSAEDTLSVIRDKINAAGVGGSAQILTVAANDHRLILSADQVGKQGGFDLKDASSTNLLQAMGFAASQTSVKTPLVSGVRSAGFLAADQSIGSQLGLESPAQETVMVGDLQIAIDLAVDSLDDIRARIEAAAPAGVSATVVSNEEGGEIRFRLEIEGVSSFADEGGVLETLGILADGAIAEPLVSGVESDRFGNATTPIGALLGLGNAPAGRVTIGGEIVEIDLGTDSLTHIQAKIEAAALPGVSATIVSDTDAAGKARFRLRIDGEVDFNDDGKVLETLGIFQRSFRPSAELQAGGDALFRINGIALSRSSNTIDDAIEGVTLQLKQAREGERVEIAVRRDDTTALRQNIEAFVQDFNAAMGLIDEQFVVPQGTKVRGALIGDSTLVGVQSQLRSAVMAQIGGLDEGFNALALIGVAFNREGRLTLDEQRLTEVLSKNLDAVRQLFVVQGKTADEKIEFISAGQRARAGSYEVEITQAAARARLIGDVEFTGALDENLTLTFADKTTGQSTQVELQAGSALDQIVSGINEQLSLETAQVRRAAIGNTTDGAAPITAETTFSQFFEAGVQDGDTIRINGTTHEGNSVSGVFTITDAGQHTVQEFLDHLGSVFNNAISASVDAQGRLMVSDNQVGPSQFSLTLIEENEGGGSLDFGSFEVETEGRFGLEIRADIQDDRLVLEHTVYGSRYGFTITGGSAQLGLVEEEVAGFDVQGTINGEAAEGVGRMLTGSSGSENVDGLLLRVSLTAEELAVGGGDRGKIDLIYGVARRLGDTLTGITDRSEGTLRNRVTAIDDTIRDLDTRVVSMERRITQYRTSLVSKFAALEGIIATMQSQGNFLTSQLANMASAAGSTRR